jgi:hypothetical protein
MRLSKKIFIFLSFLLLVFAFLFFNLFKKPKEIKASPGSEHNVWGWAYSKNIGWVSFNCYNDYNNDGVLESHCSDAGYPSNYGVNIDSSTGILSGYAWSRGTDVDVGGIGWIKFDPVGPYPAAPNYSACLDIPGISGESCDGVGDWTISGWARAYRAIEPEGQTLGGWEGWIKLRGPGYGVWLEPTGNPNEYELRGWAWGGGGTASSSAVVGWISFNCKDRGICSIANQICDSDSDCPAGQTCVSQQADGYTACTISNYKVLTSLVINHPPVASFSCHDTQDCSGPADPTCTGYIGSFCLKNNSTDTDNNISNSVWNINGHALDCSITGNPTCNYTPSGISAGTYTATLTVTDSFGLSDTTSTSITLLQDIIADFRCSLSPTGPWQNCQGFGVEEGVVVYFRDYSTPSTGATINSWSWTFEDGIPASSNVQNPTSTFTKVDADSGKVRLEVTDTAGRSDYQEYQLQLKLPLPKWKEIKP